MWEARSRSVISHRYQGHFLENVRCSWPPGITTSVIIGRGGLYIGFTVRSITICPVAITVDIKKEIKGNKLCETTVALCCFWEVEVALMMG